MKFTLRAVFSGSVVVALVCARSLVAQTGTSIHLNETGLAFAKRLIEKGQVIADRKGAWRNDRPSANDENDFIRRYGFAEYAKWHLAIDERHGENTKARYKFPFGDFKTVHRCGLLAVKARARQSGYTEIETAATELERLIEQSKSGPSAPRSPAVAGWP